MQNTKKFLIHLFIFLILVVPAVSLAANTPFVPCSNKPDSSGKIDQPCDFNALMTMVNTVIKFVLYDMVIPIAAIMFAYAGFELVTSGGSTEKRTTAKNVFTNALIGLVIAVGAFLIIKTLLSILGFKGDWIGF